MKFEEMMYYAEEEGKLPTKRGKLNAVIKDVKAYPKKDCPFEVFEKILKKHGLRYRDLTESDKRYIDRGISK